MIVRWIGVAVLIGSVLGGVLGGCVSPRPPAGNEARTVTFQPGTPQYDAEARVAHVDGAYAIDVRWGIYPISLIWTSPFGDTYSIVETRIVVREAESDHAVATHTERDTLRVADPALARSYEYEIQHARLPIEPGRYEVDIDISDRITGRSRSRTIPAVIPGVGAPSRPGYVALADPREGEPLLSFHVSADLDSLAAISTLIGSEPATVTARLIWVQSDTTVADPPFFLNRTRGSVRIRGVRSETSEILHERTWNDVEPHTDVSFAFEVARGGLHRIEFETEGDVVRRDFVVRHESFPSIEHLDVMTEALAYLTTDRELRAIRETDEPAELKRRFDAFWLDMGGHERNARQLLELYYGRVEEANRRYSGVKEGWKSDRGMVYIVRGAPLFIERTLDRETWFYSYSPANPAEVYSFERIPMFEYDGQFEQYILTRGPMYEYEWRRYIERWRAGRAP